MTKIIIFIMLFLVPSPLVAGFQDGLTCPDVIKLYNSSNTTIEVNDERVHPDQSISFDATEKKSFVVKSGKYMYKIFYPTYNAYGGPILKSFDTVSLDFSTIQWLAGNIKKIFPNGLDSISITNDTCYPIAVVYVLNAIRGKSLPIDPEETVSKVVSTDNNQKTGFLELIDHNRKKYTFIFPRRMYKKSSDSHIDWQEITLRAETIAWFNKGFQVTVR